ncbi:hypothetical protein CBS101457_006615 [Exobasidium rhododendri]|nr:hypothetical protein CBS101457_006615 [Exobasidium rhododendri]
MSSRTRGSASKEVAENDTSEGSSEVLKDGTPAVEGDEELGEDNSGSGESSNSTSTANTRSRNGRRRRRGVGHALNAADRAKAEQEAQSSLEGVELAESSEQQATAAIKSEGDDEERHDGGDEEGKQGSDGGDDGISQSSSKDSGKADHQRSASGIKELAGLGLKTLGDGEEEPLIPRRTRRGAVSPQNETTQPVEDEQRISQNAVPKVEEGEGTLNETSSENVEGPAILGEEETRCLCGSSDENVGLMIQCETCKCWQHCICMGMRTEEDCPDVYFCEQCRPEQHIALLRLLGVLPASRQIKKGGVKTQSGRLNAKDAAKELREAKEAVLTLTKENEKRRKDGRDPVTGWSVAQELEHQELQLQLQQQQQQNPGASRSVSSGQQHKRQPSETQRRSSRSLSRDDMNVPRSPPKRRSTMNSRDSAYGWESIPAHLLNDDDEEEIVTREGSDGIVRKRKRSGPAEDVERQSFSPVGGSTNQDEADSKRRRTSPAVEAAEEMEMELDEVEEEGENEDVLPSNSQGITKKTNKSRSSREQDSGKPKHPNQYTARRAAAAAAASVIAGGGSSSPSPSPSKHRTVESSRRVTTLREAVNNGSRMASPGPQSSNVRSSNSAGTPWGMPDHLSHMAFLLPSSNGPEPLKVHLASTKGMTSTSSHKGATSTATKDKKTNRITQASPQSFQIISLSEPNTKIKYPGKRTTMGEMKKRVRNILDFVSRLQIESAEREKRMKFLGIYKDPKKLMKDSAEESLSSTASIRSLEGINEQETTDAERGAVVKRTEAKLNACLAPEAQEQDTADLTAGAEEGGEQQPIPSDLLASSLGAKSPLPDVIATPATITIDANTSASTPTSTSSLKRFKELHSSSMPLVDELTRELLAFQQRYGTGSSANTMMASSSGTY